MPLISKDFVSVGLHVPARDVISSNDRSHRMAVAEQTARLRLLGARTWDDLRAAGADQLPRARCLAYLTFADERRRDANNYWPTVKALLDGTVSGSKRMPSPTWRGLLPDDDYRHLLGPDMRITKPDANLARGDLRVTLSLEVADESLFVPMDGERLQRLAA